MESMYDAFISYSQQRDVPLAEGLQEGLEKLVRKGWRRRRVLKVFRDHTSLAASSDLPGKIVAGLASSRFLVVIGSPEAAASRWVRQELAFWRANRSTDHLLLAHSAGEIAWDAARGDFDWARTTAIPRELSGAFSTEPLWVDLRAFRDAEDFSYAPRRPFRDKVVTLAAPIHGIGKDALDSRAIQEDLKATRRIRTAGAGFVVLTLGAVTAGTYAWQKDGEASERARTAASRALASRALEVASSDPRKAAQFALYAHAVAPTGEAAQALGRAVAANDSATQHLQSGNEAVAPYQGVGHSPATRVAMNRDGTVLAYYSHLEPDALNGKYAVHLRDARTGARLADLAGKSWPQDGGGLAFSWDGRLLAVETPFNEIELWDVPQRKLLRTIVASDGQALAGAFMRLRSFAFSGDGARIAATFYTSTGDSSYDFHLGVWDTATGRQVIKEKAVEDGVALAFDGTHRLLALDSSVGTVRTLDPAATTWGASRTLEGYPHLDRDARFGVTLSPDGARVSVKKSGSTRTDAWDVGSGKQLAPAAAAKAGDGRARFTADGQSVVMDDAAGRRRILGSFTYPVVSVAASGDDTKVVAASSDGAVTLFSAVSFQAGTPLPNETALKPTQLTGDRRFAVRAMTDGWEVWAVGSAGTERIGRIGGRETPTGSGSVNPVIISADRSRAVTADGDGSAFSSWNVRDGSRLGTPWRPQRSTTPVAFLPDHVHFLAMTENALQVIDARTWQVRQSLPHRTSAEAPTAVSADGTTVALIDGDELVVWRWTPEQGLHRVHRSEILGGTDFRMSVELSRQGHKAVVINGDHRLVVFDIASGRVTQGAAVSPEGQDGVAFSPDNSLLVHASGTGNDAVLRFWDAATGEERGSWAMTGHGGGGVTTFSAVDGSVLTMGADGSLVRRTVDIGAWRSMLCALAPEPLPTGEYDRYLKGMKVEAPCRTQQPARP
ncbi:TIR domain-containing protein [Streptomyces sp. WAC06614]|uniref:TIR domain-containing protein n=1 Tax=Streptomyces sp. WAC06614 TaxID=2487416 RepID=UPI00163D22CE